MDMAILDMAIYFVVFVAAMFGLVTVAKAARIVSQYERGLIMRLG